MKSVLRKIKDTNYSDIEIKVRELTNNEPLASPSLHLLQQLTRATHDATSYAAMFAMLWKRLADVEYPLHVRKALQVISYLLHHNCHERFVLDVQRRARDIGALILYQHYNEQNMDDGQPIREKAQELHTLLLDETAMQRMRSKIHHNTDSDRDTRQQLDASDDVDELAQGHRSARRAPSDQPRRSRRQVQAPEDEEDDEENDDEDEALERQPPARSSRRASPGTARPPPRVQQSSRHEQEDFDDYDEEDADASVPRAQVRLPQRTQQSSQQRRGPRNPVRRNDQHKPQDDEADPFDGAVASEEELEPRAQRTRTVKRTVTRVTQLGDEEPVTERTSTVSVNGRPEHPRRDREEQNVVDLQLLSFAPEPPSSSANLDLLSFYNTPTTQQRVPSRSSNALEATSNASPRFAAAPPLRDSVRRYVEAPQAKPVRQQQQQQFDDDQDEIAPSTTRRSPARSPAAKEQDLWQSPLVGLSSSDRVLPAAKKSVPMSSMREMRQAAPQQTDRLRSAAAQPLSQRDNHVSAEEAFFSAKPSSAAGGKRSSASSKPRNEFITEE